MADRQQNSIESRPPGALRSDGFEPVDRQKEKTTRRVVFSFWWRQQDSMKSRCGSVKPSPAALIRAAFDRFSSCVLFPPYKNPIQEDGVFVWWRQQDSNL